MKKFFEFLVGVVIISTTIATTQTVNADTLEEALVCRYVSSKDIYCLSAWITTRSNSDGSYISTATDIVLCVVEGCFNLIYDTRRPGLDAVVTTPVVSANDLTGKVLVCSRMFQECLQTIEVTTTCTPNGCISKAPTLVIFTDYHGDFNLELNTRYQVLDVVKWTPK